MSPGYVMGNEDGVAPTAVEDADGRTGVDVMGAVLLGAGVRGVWGCLAGAVGLAVWLVVAVGGRLVCGAGTAVETVGAVARATGVRAGGGGKTAGPMTVPATIARLTATDHRRPL
jgi:hypothetical protein